METICEIIDESQQLLLKRIYYSARDGMAIALYSLLNDKSEADVDYLINQVTALVASSFTVAFDHLFNHVTLIDCRINLKRLIG